MKRIWCGWNNFVLPFIILKLKVNLINNLTTVSHCIGVIYVFKKTCLQYKRFGFFRWLRICMKATITYCIRKYNLGGSSTVEPKRLTTQHNRQFIVREFVFSRIFLSLFIVRLERDVTPTRRVERNMQQYYFWLYIKNQMFRLVRVLFRANCCVLKK